MISRNDVEHIARLARIALAEEEKMKFEKELSDMLAFVEKLNEVDTAHVQPLAGGAAVHDFRDDRSGDALGADAAGLVRAAPEQRNGYVAVKAVFDRT